VGLTYGCRLFWLGVDFEVYPAQKKLGSQIPEAIPEKRSTLGRDLPLLGAFWCFPAKKCILKSDFEGLQNIDKSQNMDIELAVRMVQTPTLSEKY
jgi:hypothetical protein